MTDVIEAVVLAHRALAAAGQTDLVWGHVAVRDPDGRGVWMKAAGWGFEEINASRVVLVAPDGSVLHGDGPRHIEYPIHTEIMLARPDIQCTVHTHATPVSTFAALDIPLRAINHDGVPFAEGNLSRFPGTGSLIKTADIGRSLADALGSAPACLLPRHGLVTVGPDVAHAVMYAVLLERACQAQLTAMAAGELRSWSDAEEVATKRAECWPPSQIEAGWRYLVRLSG